MGKLNQRAHVETFKELRLTKVDPENETLLRIAKPIAKYLTELLLTTATSACGLKSIPKSIAESSLVLHCAHDVIVIHASSNKRMAPHFVVNCTDLCKQLGDLAAKTVFADDETQPYEVIVATTKKSAGKLLTKIPNLKKLLPRLEKAAKAKQDAVKEAMASGAKSLEKLQHAAAGAVKLLENKRQELKLAQAEETKLKDAEKKAAKAVEKQKLIIQCWSTKIEQNPSGAVTPQM